ncbi:MAG: DNA polymerase I, partial [Ruminococcus sp.]|nr:DNA polymerase I [Ruminococcus sp.]
AMNTPIQGSSADIIKLAMVNVYNRLKQENLNAKLILQVHDELLIESDKSCAETVAKIVKDEMENVIELSVPLTVEVNIGGSWFDAH